MAQPARSAAQRALNAAIAGRPLLRPRLGAALALNAARRPRQVKTVTALLQHASSSPTTGPAVLGQRATIVALARFATWQCSVGAAGAAEWADGRRTDRYSPLGTICARRCYSTTPSGVKSTLPSSSKPAHENSQHVERLGKEKDEGYLAFTKTSLFKLTLPLQPPSSDPNSRASKRSSPKARAEALAEQRHQDSNRPRDNDQNEHAEHEHSKEAISSQPWEQAAETPGPPVSQLKHRPHQQLHGPEQGEPANNEAEEYDAEAPAHSVVFLLHSGQPLSYIASLIRAEGPSPEPSEEQTEAERLQQTDSSDPSSQLAPSPQPAVGSGADARTTFSKHQLELRQRILHEGFADPLGDPPISFHTRAADGKRWSPSTGIGDFLRDAARIGSFIIRIGKRNITVQVPSFEDRTRFLRASLYAKTRQIEHLVKIKDDCDRIAHTSTRRFAIGGVGILGAWWTSVAWLTFYTELGWDTMEPVTYLTGLGTLMGGYVWFLVHNREVSYRAVLNETTSRRQQKLYIERGFNVDQYQELIEDVKELRRSIKKVAEEYDLEWDQGETQSGKTSKRALKIIRQQEATDDRPRRSRLDDDEDPNDHDGEFEDKDGDGQPDHLQSPGGRLGKRQKKLKANGPSETTRAYHTLACASGARLVGAAPSRVGAKAPPLRSEATAIRRFGKSAVVRSTEPTRQDPSADPVPATNEPRSGAKRFSLRPYLMLSRIDKPIGTWLLFWPCAWSITLASHTLGLGYTTPLFYTFIFGVGAVVMRGAGCTINDMWDVKMDRMVERTKTRPLAAGDVTQFQALCFLGVQLSAGLAMLLQLNWYSIMLGASSLSLVTVYPLMKRITHWPQLVLGLAFNWGAMLGWSAVAGSVAWHVVFPLYAGSVFWTLVYDTIYAHQDKRDDVHAGVKSTALLFGQQTKPILSTFSAATVGLFGYAANQAVPPADVGGATALSTLVDHLPLTVGAGEALQNLGGAAPLLEHHPVFTLALAGAASHLAWQIRTVQLDSRPDCWAKFVSNTTVGWIVFGGLAADYALWLYLQRLSEQREEEEEEEIKQAPVI